MARRLLRLGRRTFSTSRPLLRHPRRHLAEAVAAAAVALGRLGGGGGDGLGGDMSRSWLARPIVAWLEQASTKALIRFSEGGA